MNQFVNIYCLVQINVIVSETFCLLFGFDNYTPFNVHQAKPTKVGVMENLDDKKLGWLVKMKIKNIYTTLTQKYTMLSLISIFCSTSDEPANTSLKF